MAADRKVKVSLVADVSNMVAGLDAAAKKTREVGSEAEKAAQKAKGLADLGAGMLAIGVVAAVGVGMAVKSFADFDQKLSNIKAATNESAENMGLLREAALQAGADTAFSAGEAADAVTELAKAGVATADILSGGLTGALDLAAAGEISVARAAEIAATAMTQFKLEGSEVGKVADLLSSGANKAQGGVEDLSGALSQGGLVAAATGLSIEETVGTLSAFASAGLLGSDAGTSFKSMLQRLTPQSAVAEKEMERLGISAYDAQGGFIGMEKFAGNLQTAMKDLTPEQRNASQAIIFGSDAVRASNILYEQGAKGIGKWISEVDDSGAAARTAATKLDNLNGDLQILGGSFETALITSGSGANEVLREMTQAATFLVNAFGDLPAPVLDAGLAVGAVVAAVGLVGGTALIAVPKVAAFKLALDAVGISGGKAALGVGLLTGGLVIAGAAVAIFVGEQAKGAAKVDAYTGSLEEQSAALTGYTRELAVANLTAKQSFGPFESESTFDAAEKLGISLDVVTEAALGNVKALKQVAEESAVGAAGSDLLKRQMDETGLSALELAEASQAVAFGVKGESESVAEAIRVAKQKQAVDADSVDASGSAEDAYRAEAEAAGELQANLSTLIDTINEANGVGQDAVSQNIAYEAALDEVGEQIENVRVKAEGYVAGISAATAEGRDNLGMLNEQAKAAQGAAKATFEAGGSAEEYQATLVAGRQALIDNAVALGATGDEAQALADKIFNIPSSKEVAITANTASALAEVNRFIRDTSGRRVELIVDGVAGRRVVGSQVTAKATGGAITGPGTGTSDTAGLYALSNGEHVLTAAEVAAMGGQSAVYDFRRGLKSPSYMSAPSLSSGGGFGSSSRGGDTFTIYETTDPVATAQAVQRRQSALGSV